MAQAPHEVLGVPGHASRAEIHTAYGRVARECHPDRNPGFQKEATERFRSIQEAYEALVAAAPSERHEHRSTEQATQAEAETPEDYGPPSSEATKDRAGPQRAHSDFENLRRPNQGRASPR